MDFLLLNNRKKYFEKINIDIKKGKEYLFDQLVKIKTIPSMIQLDLVLDNINILGDELITYFNFLVDIWKIEINNSKSKFHSNIKIVNSAISHFIKIFFQKFQSYNNKHNSIMKQLILFLQIFFNELNQRLIVLDLDEGILNSIESYFMLIVTFITYFPNLVRTFQNNIEELINHVFTLYFHNNKLNICNMESFIIVYSMLFRLSPSIDVKFAYNINLIILNIKMVSDIFKTIKLDEKEIQNKKLLFIKYIQNYNLSHGIKVINLYFAIMRNYFILIPKNVFVNIDYISFFSMIKDIIEQYGNNCNLKNKSLDVLELLRDDYSIFLQNAMRNIFEILMFQFKYFNSFLSPYHSIVSSILNLLLLYHNNFQNNFILNKAFLEMINLFIIKNSKSYPRNINEILYKYIYSTFPSLYFEFLEQNDKTAIKMNNTFFKLGNQKMSLIQKSHSLSSGKLFSHYSIKENSEILFLYLTILNSYILSNHYSTDKRSKEALTGIINLLIIPSYSKFIFELNEEIKKQIIILLDNYVRRNKCILHREKIYSFLKGFYSKDDFIHSYCNKIIRTLSVNDTDINKFNPKEITDQIIVLDEKVAEIIKDKYTLYQEEMKKNTLFLNKKRRYDSESQSEDEQKEKVIPIKIKETIENFQYVNNKIILEEYNKVKNGDKEFNKSIEDKFVSEEKKSHNEKEQKEEEEEEIEIPDII